MGEIGRWLIGAGLLLLVVGAVFLVLGRVTGLGHLPGDIVIERQNLKVFIPIGTMILISIILTVLLNLITRIGR